MKRKFPIVRKESNCAWLHRSVRKKVARQHWAAVWIILMSQAEYKRTDNIFFDGHIIRLDPGECIISNSDICEETGLSRKVVRNILEEMERDGYIQRIKVKDESVLSEDGMSMVWQPFEVNSVGAEAALWRVAVPLTATQHHKLFPKPGEPAPAPGRNGPPPKKATSF